MLALVRCGDIHADETDLISSSNNTILSNSNGEVDLSVVGEYFAIFPAHHDDCCFFCEA